MAHLERHPDGVTTVDAEYTRPMMAAVHIVEHAGRAAIVDTGTNHSVPHVLAALSDLGLQLWTVDYLFLTHVHLDHAGGAGALMQVLPNARAVLHPRGAPHLVDPAKLIAGSIAVYGEAAYAALYGQLVPIPPERIVVTQDGDRVALAGRVFEFWHTPGHALHHHVIVDRDAGIVFTGDTLGVSYRELATTNGAFVVPTTTPTQFDPEQLAASIARIAAARPRAAYLTHYGRVENVERVSAALTEQVQELAAMATAHRGAPDAAIRIRAAMHARWLVRARDHGVQLSDAAIDDILRGDLELNVQGLMAWLQRTG